MLTLLLRAFLSPSLDRNREGKCQTIIEIFSSRLFSEMLEFTEITDCGVYLFQISRTKYQKCTQLQNREDSHKIQILIILNCCDLSLFISLSPSHSVKSWPSHANVKAEYKIFNEQDEHVVLCTMLKFAC